MDIAHLNAITDAQQLREIVIGQMSVLAERDALQTQVAERDARLADYVARLAQRDAHIALCDRESKGSESFTVRLSAMAPPDGEVECSLRRSA